MNHKRTKKRDDAGLYIAIVCCILAIALIGYVNSGSKEDELKDKILSEQVLENVVVEDNIKPTPLPVLTGEDEFDVIEEKPVAKSKPVVEEARFVSPVNGKVLEEFSKTQVYYESIGEWRTHNGIDLSCNVGDSVSAAGDGVIIEHTQDSLGYGIKIDHGDNLITAYSNLQENLNVNIGDSVKKGDVIGYAGQSALSDMADDMHIHFEVIENGEFKDPKSFLMASER